MTAEDVIKLTEAVQVCTGNQSHNEIKYAVAADLMSDILTVNTDELLLITGMANLQVIRTAEMSDISTVLFVRGKNITEEMCELAKENGITLLQSKMSMFNVCGILYKAGLKPVF
ncbi:MAG: hypothetical protein LBM07_02665 [Culturomica sp.]|jgi:predicted transcriptional regulator|nr:hypothetical protein [Culturomica sp.]